MKIIAAGFSLVSLALGISGAHAQYANVVISGEIQPGVYGRVEFGNRPPPVLINPQPVVVIRDRRYTDPVYLHVPPGHAKNWDKHCHKYNACYKPVHFVKSVEHEPGYQHDKGQSKGKGKGKGKSGH